MDDREVSSYTSINIPVAETIGEYAFYNGDMSTVKIEESVKEIGFGAFASAKKLKTIRVDSNRVFFVEDNVLYRYIDREANTYELVCYPSAKAVTEDAESGLKTYSIKEGTVRIMACAFYELNEDVLDKVIIPYSVNAIGDLAFYDSGVTEYVFESIQAPVLESIYRQEIAEQIKAQATETTAAFYKGYYYANFDTQLYNYTKYGTETSNLVMYYPENGVGYNNHIYNLYFGEKHSLGILLEDSTRACITLIENMPSPEEVKDWLYLDVNEKNTSMIENFSETVKAARQYYNNASKNAEQFAFVSEEIEQKLLQVETELRAVKEHFNIPIRIASLEVAAESTHKNEYRVGDVFDMTGLVVTVIYDDFSTETLDTSKLTLLNTNKLTKYDRFVTVEYEGESVAVEITVTETTVEKPVDSSSVGSSSSSSATESSSIRKVALIVMGVVLLLVGGFGVWILYKRRPVLMVEDDDEDESDYEDEYGEEEIGKFNGAIYGGFEYDDDESDYEDEEEE